MWCEREEIRAMHNHKIKISLGILQYFHILINYAVLVFKMIKTKLIKNQYEFNVIFMLISQGNKHELDMIAQFKFICV